MSLPAAVAIRRPPNSIGRIFADALRDHWAMIAIVVPFVIGAIVAQRFLLGDRAATLSLYSEAFVLLLSVFAVCFLTARVFYVMVFVRPPRLAAHILHDLTSRFLTGPRLTQGVLVLMLLYPFISAFTLYKTLIPVLNPFYLDSFFVELDRFLHGGLDPWVLLHPLLGTPFVTFLINATYNLWFFVLFGVVLWQAFSQKNEMLRQQFLLTFVLLWVSLGVVCATALSSAGPVYYGRVTGLEDPFAPLMAYLRGVNDSYAIWALATQEMLWAAYDSGALTAGSGISAMPSLHVATSFSFVLVGWKSSRALGVLFGLFAAIILVGSVHLGWHYAVDGYVSIALTALIWWAVGRWLVRKRP